MCIIVLQHFRTYKYNKRFICRYDPISIGFIDIPDPHAICNVHNNTFLQPSNAEVKSLELYSLLIYNLLYAKDGIRIHLPHLCNLYTSGKKASTADK